MNTVNISTFKATCLALLEKVNKTRQPILVLKRGQAIAQIVPPPLPEKPLTWLGSFAATATIAGDVIAPVVVEQDLEALTP